jgi:subtilisin-like proprotein convertase family protein
VTTEDGGADTFTVLLDSQPTALVTIAVSSSDTGEGTVSPASLSFDSTNWSTPQTVTVTGVDDAEQDGNVAYTIITAPATGAPEYAGIDPADVSVTNLDNDGQGNYFESQDVPKNIIDPHPKKGTPRPATSELVIESTGITVDLIDVDVTIEHALMSDLTVTLTSPLGTEAPLAYDGANWDLVNADAFKDEPLDGTWVLTVTDTQKNGYTGTLTAWSITVTPLTEGAPAPSQSAAATDLALLAWADLDSSDHDDADPLATQPADELALMLVE